MILPSAVRYAGDGHRTVGHEALDAQGGGAEQSAFEAVGRRLKRNYVFIFMIILVSGGPSMSTLRSLPCHRLPT